MLDAAAYDEAFADLSRGHKLTFAFGGDVKIDGEQLFLVLLRAEILVVRFERIDVVEVEPIKDKNAPTLMCQCI